MEEGNTVVNALVGGVVTVVLTAFVPFSPLFGGAVAGYLEGGDRSDGIRVGAYAGAVAFVPGVAVGLLVFSLVSAVFLGGYTGLEGVLALSVLSVIGLVFVVAVALLTVVGLSALGGWLGNYVKYDTDVDL